jgi:hypothetical protein
MKARAANGKRIYPNRVRHVWVREFSEEENATFILVFFLTKMPIITWEIMKLKVIYE